VYPDGYGDPEKMPLYPQTKAARDPKPC